MATSHTADVLSRLLIAARSTIGDYKVFAEAAELHQQLISAPLRTQGDPEATAIRSAIRELSNASFACGEWSADDSEEDYSAAYARSNAAGRYLCALLGISANDPGVQDVLSPLDKIRAALVHLKLARDLLREAGAPKATDKVRSALKSAQGAERHALHAPYREARKAQDPALELEMFRRVNR
jgi:hypothetical protein